MYATQKGIIFTLYKEFLKSRRKKKKPQINISKENGKIVTKEFQTKQTEQAITCYV